MGLLSWLFPSAEDRVAKAQRLLERESWADARLEVLDLDHPDVPNILEQAERALAQQNLEAALSWARAGDGERVQIHLELANQFQRPGMESLFRDGHRAIREVRDSLRAEAQQQQLEKEARLNSIDPLGLTGTSGLLAPPGGPDLAAEGDDERQARLALLIENYPDALRDHVGVLDATFAEAVLALEDGNPEEALQGLLLQPDDNPLVSWERARTAQALGDPIAASRSLRRFADLAGGHFAIGRQHTGVLLAQLTAQAGDTHEALRILRDLRRVDPDVGTGLFAQLLEATDALEDAESVLVAAVRKHPKTLPFYSLLARVRLKGGHRVAAMTALERAMDQCACGTGRCGTVPVDADIVRTLATLYFEDGMETERALELADQAAGLVQQPRFEDAYLAGLAGRARQDPQAEALILQLHEAVPTEDPRHPSLVKHLPLASQAAPA